MKVKPKRDYKLLGTEISLDSSLVYDAVNAINIPNWKRDGIIFITNAKNDSSEIGFMLSRGEYEVVA